MVGPLSSPPAFHWDDWYKSVGGRTINIAEVDEYLRQIREYQDPRFNGPVNPDQTIFENALRASSVIKAKAFELGADEAGIAIIEPSDIYKGRQVNERYAIVVAQ